MEMINCACDPSPPIVLVMGVERCSNCTRLAGGDAFRPFGGELPTKAARRRRVNRDTKPTDPKADQAARVKRAEREFVEGRFDPNFYEVRGGAIYLKPSATWTKPLAGFPNVK